MRSHSEIIRKATASVVAELTGVKIHTVRSWVQRNSIPADQWATLVAEGHCTPDELMAFAPARKRAA